MNEFETRKQKLIEEFESLYDVQDKYTFIIETGREHGRLDDEFHSDCYQVKGCMSRLWLIPSYKQGACYFQIDSDAEIPKGIAVTLVNLVQGLRPAEILAADYQFLRQIGIGSILSPNRRNALAHILNTIKEFAAHCDVSEESLSERPYQATAMNAAF